jgi:hypothetical protein
VAVADLMMIIASFAGAGAAITSIIAYLRERSSSDREAIQQDLRHTVPPELVKMLDQLSPSERADLVAKLMHEGAAPTPPQPAIAERRRRQDG